MDLGVAGVMGESLWGDCLMSVFWFGVGGDEVWDPASRTNSDVVEEAENGISIRQSVEQYDVTFL